MLLLNHLLGVLFTLSGGKDQKKLCHSLSVNESLQQKLHKGLQVKNVIYKPDSFKENTVFRKHLKIVSQRLWVEDRGVTSSTTSSGCSLQMQTSSSSSSRYYRYCNIDPAVEAIIMDRDAPFEVCVTYKNRILAFQRHKSACCVDDITYM